MKKINLKYLLPKYLTMEIHRYGYHFSFMSYLELVFAAFLGMGGIGYLFGLKWKYIAIIMAVCLVLLPTVILTAYKDLYEQKKFVDASNYMEQLLYSFKRKSKIVSALFDTLTLFPSGELHDAITKTISYIQNSNTEGKLYEEAFAFIETGYGCQRVIGVHRFLEKVEAIGGTYEESAEILMDDRNRWVERVYEMQKEKQRIKRNMTIAIICSFLIVGSTVLLLPKDFKDVTKGSVSQTATTAVILTNVLLWAFVQKKLSGSLIMEEVTSGEDVRKRYYHRVMKEGAGAAPLMVKGAALLLIGSAGICCFVLKEIQMALLLLVLSYLVLSNPKRTYKAAVKKMSREVEKAFPEWMMSMALLLQTDNAHVAFAKTIPNSPEILKEELESVLRGIETEPNSVQPYISFFRKLQLPDVESAMKMLYSVAEYGSDHIGRQIAVLVQRNSVMMDKAEHIKEEDYLAGISFFILTPMITGSAKMLVDMMLLIVSLLKYTTML